MGWALDLIRKWLVTPIAFMPLLHQSILHGSRTQVQWMDDTDDYYSPPVAL